MTVWKTGEDFGELAKQFSDDPGTAPLGGDLGFFSRGQFLPEFEDAGVFTQTGRGQRADQDGARIPRDPGGCGFRTEDSSQAYPDLGPVE